MITFAHEWLGTFIPFYFSFHVIGSLLVTLPVLALLLFIMHKSVASKLVRYDNDGLLKSKTDRKQMLLKPVGLLVCLILITIGVAGPLLPMEVVSELKTTRSEPPLIPSRSLEAFVVLDTSISMGAEDYRSVLPRDPGEKTQVLKPWGSRFDMSKAVIESMLQRIGNNDVGLITFKGKAYSFGPLTYDFDPLRSILEDWITLGSAPGKGTNYAKGLKLALSELKTLAEKDATKRQAIVLISDGGYMGDSSELAEVVELLHKQNVHLVIVGVGKPPRLVDGQTRGSYIPIYKNGMFSSYLSDLNGRAVETSLDEKPLKELQAMTRAQYFRIDDFQSVADINWPTALGIEFSPGVSPEKETKSQVKPIRGFADGDISWVFTIAAILILFAIYLPVARRSNLTVKPKK